MLIAYWRWAQSQYTPSELSSHQTVIRLMRRMYGTTPAERFGPKRLRLLRECMIKGDPDADPPRRPWSRPHINRQVHRLGAMFKWAAGHEMMPISVYHQLKSIEPLKRGRCEAPEPDPVGPAPEWLIDPIRPHVSRQVWALVELQLLTGARGGELFSLRPIDIDTSDDIWKCALAEHKTAHHGKARTLYFGPKAQAVISPFLQGRSVDAFLFSPAEAEAERRAAQHAARCTPMGHGNGPGTNCIDDPTRSPRDQYTSDSYRRAIQRGCDLAFPLPEPIARKRVPARGRKAGATRWETENELKRRLGEKGRAELAKWRKAHRWHPHQLRHNAATHLRREFGLEAAQLALGHASAAITDAVYAERDQTRVIDIMRRIG
ncbi:MAG: tyrosine-type recombinase/integrase [Planctomycetes bacterium]|nr:tyrosine-type recombinase/integrase [Planctomycetota bacterium]